MNKRAMFAAAMLAAASVPAAADDLTWRDDVGPVITAKCGACHGAKAPEFNDWMLLGDEKRKKVAPRMDTYPAFMSFVVWPATGAMMRRLDDGAASGGKAGNMYRYLGASDEERALVIACIQPLLDALPSDATQLLRWADMEGRSMQSIADELGISLTAAKSRVQRARKDFVKTTSECCAITVDARGRVTGLTPRNTPKAIECASCVTDPDLKSRIRHEC